MSSAVDIQFFESAARSWPRHWHEELQVVVSLSGFARHESSGSRQKVGPGGVFVVDPGTIHTTVADEESRWGFITAHLPPTLFARFLEENEGSGSRSLSFSPSVFRDAEVRRMLVSLHRAAIDDWSRLSRDQCLQDLIRFLWSISRQPLRLPRRFAQGRHPLNAARDYLEEHFATKVTLRQLSGLAGLSEFHFCRRFSQQYGLSPHAYQVQLRLLAAKRMLRQSRPIGETARSAGFSSQSHFSRQFLKTNGITPGKFQKNSKIVLRAGLL